MFLRKSASDISDPNAAPYCHTRLAQLSNAGSSVNPRSSVIGSNCVRPVDLRLELGSPPSRFSTTPVVRTRPDTFVRPGTYCPSHFTRKLKFLYGSKRVGLFGNSGM